MSSYYSGDEDECSKASSCSEGDQKQRTREARMEGQMNKRLRSSCGSTSSHDFTPHPSCTSRCAKGRKTPESLGREAWSSTVNPPQLRAEASKPFPWRTWSDLAIKKRSDDLDRAREVHKKKFQATLDSLIEEFENGAFTARIHSVQIQEIWPHQEKTVTPEDVAAGDAEDETGFLNNRTSAALPAPQKVQVSFRVHYVTQSPSQMLAVIGNQQELGTWESFVLLQEVKNGFWANTITLSAGNKLEWKFILVEDGKIQRWEECRNRQLLVPSKGGEIQLHCKWGCP